MERTIEELIKKNKKSKKYLKNLLTNFDFYDIIKM